MLILSDMEGVEMTFLIIALIVLVLIAAAAKQKNGKKKYSFGKKDFMNNAERGLFFKMVEALPDFFVFPQVSLIELIKPVDYPSKGKILSAHVDFAVFDKELKKCCVVELDGGTHDTGKQKSKDADRDDFLGQAGIKVLRYKTRQNVTAETLRADVTAAMADEKPLAKKGGK